MKRKICQAILPLIIAIICFSCASDPENTEITTTQSSTQNNSSEDTTTQTTTTVKKPISDPAGPGIIPIIGGVRAESESYQVKQNGVVALEVNLSLPVAEIEDNEEVQQKLTERLDAIRTDLDGYIKSLEEQYKNMISLGSPPLFTPVITVSFELNYFTEKAMSLSFYITEVNGYGVTTLSGRHYNYEFDFASIITFSAAFSDGDALINAICEKAKERSDLFPNHDALISSLADSSWYFADGSIVFKFNPYDIAPASCGYVVFEFTTDEISDYISDYGKDLLGIS